MAKTSHFTFDPLKVSGLAVSVMMLSLENGMFSSGVSSLSFSMRDSTMSALSRSDSSSSLTNESIYCELFILDMSIN